MKLPSAIARYLTWPWGYVAAAVVSVLVCAALFWLITWPSREHQKAVDANAGREFGEARSQSGRQAINTITNNERGAEEIDARVKGSEDAVRSAPADQRDDVAVRELCKSPSAANQPACRMQHARP